MITYRKCWEVERKHVVLSILNAVNTKRIKEKKKGESYHTIALLDVLQALALIIRRSSDSDMVLTRCITNAEQPNCESGDQSSGLRHNSLLFTCKLIDLFIQCSELYFIILSLLWISATKLAIYTKPFILCNLFALLAITKNQLQNKRNHQISNSARDVQGGAHLKTRDIVVLQAWKPQASSACAWFPWNAFKLWL